MSQPSRAPAFLSGDAAAAGPAAWRALWLVVGLGCLLFPFLWKPWIHGNDGVRNYAYCRSFWMDGDFDFENEFVYYTGRGELQALRRDGRTGRAVNSLGCGSAMLWSPFFGAGHLLALLGPWETDGYSAPYVWAVCLGSFLYGLAGLALLAWGLARRFGTGVALAAVGAVWFGSPLWFYMYLHPSMSHACSFFLAALLLTLFLHWQRGAGPWALGLLGLVAGLATATRFSDGVGLLLPAVCLLRSGGGVRRRVAGALALGAGVLVAMGPQLASWQAIHGYWWSGPKGYQLDKQLSVFTSPYLLDLLFSARRGLFVWSPVLVLGLAGALRGWARGGWFLGLLLAMFIVQAWVVGGWHMWWGGASFGQRFFINCLPLFVWGLGYGLDAMRKGWHRVAAVLAILLCLLWSGGLAVQYVSGMVSREGEVGWAELWENQYRGVPRWLAGNLGLLLPGERIEAERGQP